MISFTSEAMKTLQAFSKEGQAICLRIYPAGAVSTGVFLNVALEEPHAGDILCESSGFCIALQKRLTSQMTITIDYQGQGFTATLG